MSVRQVTTRVLVDGVDWGHESATWTGRSSGALPTHLGGGGSRWDTTAEIVWWSKGVHTTLPSPWTGDRVPADGSKVEIFAQSTGPERLVFTGVVTSSSADGPTVTSRCIDTRDRLRRTIRTEPVSTFTPPHEDGWSFNTRTICTPLWPVYQIARAGGLNATYVPAGITTHIDVPMVGAIWVARERKLMEIVLERREMAAEAKVESDADTAAGAEPATPPEPAAGAAH